MRNLNADPAFAAANAERMRKLHADPAFAAANAERMRKLHADPAFAAANAERAAERMRKLHADRRGFEVPGWVDCAGLRDDYCDIAATEGDYRPTPTPAHPIHTGAR